MREVNAIPGQELHIGRCGENLATCVTFNISEWKKLYGEGTVQLIHQRNGDKTPYPCVVSVTGDVMSWNVTNADVEKAGRGRAEVQYFVDEVRVKSETFATVTERALGPAGETPPAPYQSWMDKMMTAGSQAVESAQVATDSATSAAASAAAAAQSAQNAFDSEAMANSWLQDAKNAADDSQAARDEAVRSMNAAEAAQAESERLYQEIKDMSGDVGASVEYVDRKMAEAETNAKNASVQKTGDTMTGNLKLQPYGDGYSVVKKNANSDGDYGLQMQDYGDDGSFMGLTISAKSQKLEFKKKPAGASSYTYPTIYSSDNPPDPSEVNAVPIWGGTMTGALTLSGDPYQAKHAATKQYVDALKKAAEEHINNEDNPHNVTREQIGAAPAGYGLGNDVSYVTPETIDTTYKSGWYNYNGAGTKLNGISFNYATLRVDGNDQQNFTQFLMPVGFDNPYILTRKAVFGVLGEWECDNPPMDVGIEYRTTERYLGKPVYAKLVEVGWMAKGSHTIEHKIGVVNPISIEMYNHYNSVLTNNDSVTKLYFSNSHIIYTCVDDLGNVAFVIKFTVQ